MFNLFSKDIGIDLGTASVLVYIKGKGVVLREPSVVAMDKNTGKLLKVGTDAQAMLGRTPGNIVAMRPLREGVISDYDMTERMLKEFIKKVTTFSLFKPRLLICVPSGITEVEERAVIDAGIQAGARRVYLIEEPVAAAIGAGIDIAKPDGHMIVDIGGGTTDCSLLLMGPQWHHRRDRENSLLGHSGCRVGGNDLDIALAFKSLMPLLGMGGQTEKGIALPILPWWNAIAINDVPAQSDFYSTANGRFLNDLVRDAQDAEKVALLYKVWRQRLSYRVVRTAEESKIALSDRPEHAVSLPFISDDLATAITQEGLEMALTQPLQRILEQVQLALENGNVKPDVIYLTGGSARSPLIKKALAEQLPGIPIAGGDDFGSVTAGLARWAQVVFS